MIRTLDRDYLSPLLQEHGFKKKDLTWNQAVDDIVRVLDVQISKFSGPDRMDLTVNVGVWMRPVWMIYTAKAPPKFVKEHDCWPSFRIGQVMADFRRDALDKWWTLTSVDDVEGVGVELRTIVSDKCLPFLDGFRSPSDVKSFYDTTDLRLMPGGKLNLAILNYLLGDREGYERLIADFSDKKLSAWQPRAAEVVQRLEGSTPGISR